MERSKRVKVQISLSRDLLTNLDTYCRAIGVSRSAYVQTVLGQNLYSMGAVQRKVEEVLQAAAKDASTQV